MIFIVIAIMLLVLTFIYDYRGAKRGRLFWYLAILVFMILAAGLRYQMGADSIRYEEYYESAPTLSHLRKCDFTERYAPLFVILMAACRSVTSEFMLVQFVVSIIVNCIFLRFIWKHTNHVFFAGFLYFIFLYFMLNMQVLREALASCVFLLSWPYFVKGEWLKYYLMCVVAFFFHVSAIMLFFIPMVELPGVRWLFRFGPRTIVISLLVLAGSFVIKYFMFDFIRMIAITESMTERADSYAEGDMGGNMLNVIGTLCVVIKQMIYPLASIYFLRASRKMLGKNSDGNREEERFETMTILSIYFAMLSVGVMVFSRYSNYFSIFSLIVISRWTFSFIKDRRRLLRLNYLYWMILLTPLVSIEVMNGFFTKYNASGTLKRYDQYFPYSNQLDKELSPKKKKVINYGRKYW
jgi:hypothetical protein